MTLYVSKSAGFSAVIHGGLTKPTDVKINGQIITEHLPVIPYLEAQFSSSVADVSRGEKKGILASYAREYARRVLEPRNLNSHGEPITGAYREDRVVTVEEDFYDEEGNVVTRSVQALASGSDYAGQYGWFDTDDPNQCPPEWKELYEERLNEGLRAGEYIVVPPEAIPAPWPKYDSILTAAGVTKETVVKRILDGIEVTGADPHEVRSYEAATLARDYVLEAVEKLINNDDALAREQAALTARA